MTKTHRFHTGAKDLMEPSAKLEWVEYKSFCDGATTLRHRRSEEKAKARLPKFEVCELKFTRGDKRRRRKLEASARTHAETVLAQIELLAKDGCNRKLKEAVLRYFDSYKCKLTAYHDARLKMKKRHRPHLYALSDFAASLNPLHMEFESARISLKDRAGQPDQKELRPVMSFGIHHRARQEMVLNVLRACMPLPNHPNQFGVKARGVKQAVETVAQKLMSDEVQFVAEYDIENFFPSIGEEAGLLKSHNVLTDQLPFLPKGVVESTVLRSGILAPLVYAPGSEALNLQNDTQSGVPQGSAVSSYLAEYTMHDIMTEAETLGNQGCQWLSYVDNVLVFSRDSDDVNGLRLPLGICARNSRFGDFRFNINQAVRHKSQGFLFLGHYFKHVDSPKPTVIIEVSEKNQRKLHNKLDALLRRFQPTSFGSRRYVHTMRKQFCDEIREWAKSFYSGNPLAEGYRIGHECLQDHPRASQHLRPVIDRRLRAL